MTLATKRRARRRKAAKATPVAANNAHPIGRSFLGQHYKAWRESADAKKFAGAELGCYCAYNDVSDDARDKLRAWEAAGFP